MNSRNKGAAGEREVAGILRGYGYKARRGQQYSGANGDADVVGLPGIPRSVIFASIAEDACACRKHERKGLTLPTFPV